MDVKTEGSLDISPAGTIGYTHSGRPGRWTQAQAGYNRCAAPMCRDRRAFAFQRRNELGDEDEHGDPFVDLRIIGVDKICTI
jgi:hypothetical protein